MKTRIACVSDLHGNLIDIPDCDLLLITGDIVPLAIQRDMIKSMKWLENEFTDWLDRIEDRKIKVLSIWGNHDFVGEKHKKLHLEHNFLYDRLEEFNGLKIYGTPYQNWFGGWAFNLWDNELKKKYDLIPEDTDILLVHNPPYGILDYNEYGEHCGSVVLKNRLAYLNNLKLLVFGHIHEGYGKATNSMFGAIGEEIHFVNCSICNEDYEPINKPILVEI